MASEPLVRAVRGFRPHVILTYDEQGGYPHPDHIKTHEVSVEAFDAAADPERYPGTGEPWQPLKLYYHVTFHKARLEALHEAVLAARGRVPVREWLEAWEDEPPPPGAARAESPPGSRAGTSSRCATRR